MYQKDRIYLLLVMLILEKAIKYISRRFIAFYHCRKHVIITLDFFYQLLIGPLEIFGHVECYVYLTKSKKLFVLSRKRATNTAN